MTQGDAIYLDLESRQHRVAERVERLCGSELPHQLLVGHRAPRLDDGFYTMLDGLLKERPRTRLVVVDTRTNQLRVFEAAPTAMAVEVDEDGDPDAPPAKPARNSALVASFPITPGQPRFIHFGVWEIRNIVELPVWRYDQQLLSTGKRSNNAITIPPGPNSPVGVIWHSTSRSGIGLHGTSDPETIGRARSAGCIRMANWDAVRLPNLIRPGAMLEIR